MAFVFTRLDKISDIIWFL